MTERTKQQENPFPEVKPTREGAAAVADAARIAAEKQAQLEATEGTVNLDTVAALSLDARAAELAAAQEAELEAVRLAYPKAKSITRTRNGSIAMDL